MAINKIVITVKTESESPYGTTTSVEVFTKENSELVRGVEVLKIINEAAQSIIEQMRN